MNSHEFIDTNRVVFPGPHRSPQYFSWNLGGRGWGWPFANLHLLALKSLLKVEESCLLKVGMLQRYPEIAKQTMDLPVGNVSWPLEKSLRYIHLCFVLNYICDNDPNKWDRNKHRWLSRAEKNCQFGYLPVNSQTKPMFSCFHGQNVKNDLKLPLPMCDYQRLRVLHPVFCPMGSTLNFRCLQIWPAHPMAIVFRPAATLSCHFSETFPNDAIRRFYYCKTRVHKPSGTAPCHCANASKKTTSWWFHQPLNMWESIISPIRYRDFNAYREEKCVCIRMCVNRDMDIDTS